LLIAGHFLADELLSERQNKVAVDEVAQAIHNLASLLFADTTICERSARPRSGVINTGSLTINSR
jgi:hypothetical protein